MIELGYAKTLDLVLNTKYQVNQETIYALVKKLLSLLTVVKEIDKPSVTTRFSTRLNTVPKLITTQKVN